MSGQDLEAGLVWLAKKIYEKALGLLTTPAGGFGIVEALGSGFSVEGERMENVEKLRSILESVVNDPSLLPKP